MNPVSRSARMFLLPVMMFLFTAGNKVTATHIVGGEMYYEYSGNSTYIITLVVYRDCYYGVPPFDPVASIGIFTGTNQLFTELCLAVRPDSTTIPPTINSPCFIPPTNVCYRRGYYRSNPVYLPANQTGYHLAYQRCCRNNTILNIINPGDVGITINAFIPPAQSVATNSNPVFKSLPPPFLCMGVPFTFDHSATDTDGDSLVYEICNPFVGGDPNSCGAAPCGFPLTCGPAPHPPHNPPYSNVIWQSPFSLSNLMGGIPITIDPQSGMLTATPNTIGQFVVGVCVVEYRNGILLSRTKRDLQFNVVACPTLVVAAAQTPIINCNSNTIQFQNQSIGAGSYFWSFGDPSTTADTSHAVSPSWTYPGTGTYNYTLIAYSQFNPGCADTLQGEVKIYPAFDADFSFVLIPCSFAVNFTSVSQNSGSGFSAQWNWNFGDNTTSNIQNPPHTYPGPGTYSVTLTTVSDSGCVKTINKQISIDPMISVAVIPGNPVTCSGDCNASLTANVTDAAGSVSYLWSNNSSTGNTVSNLCAGTYIVTVTDSLNCTASQSFTISDPPPLAVTVSATDDYCGHLCIGSAFIEVSGGNGAYTYLWNDPQSQQSAYIHELCEGNYQVTVTDANGCTMTASVSVGYQNYYPPFAADPGEIYIYEGQSVNITSSLYPGATYQWSPPDWLNSTSIPDPVSTPGQSIVYFVEFADSNGCPARDTVRIFVRKTTCNEPEIFIPNAFTPDDDGNNDILYVRGNTIRDLIFRIYNRWGEKVFETTLPQSGWNGTFKGKKVQPGVYDYYLEITCVNREKFFKKGNVTLIR
ncbi:MAG: gliding motility-associated C-terminal domain-containing protein [Bacteroidia bacterium]|nr:gliding motility-associated C-terminal domain-containing protein [Bacteroidia bacterium]MCZ2277356.1 gliding motility-associated C-terminal domain-containing protein [Bacteroidia bacterium]